MHLEDNHAPIPGTPFNYDEVDGPSPLDKCDATCPFAAELATERASAGVRKVMEWIWQDFGAKNADGIEIRAMIVCWVFLPELAPTSMAGIAAITNRDRQSIGRWFDDFKLRFPHIKTAHMKLNETRNHKTNRAGVKHNRQAHK